MSVLKCFKQLDLGLALGPGFSSQVWAVDVDHTGYAYLTYRKINTEESMSLQQKLSGSALEEGGITHGSREFVCKSLNKRKKASKATLNISFLAFLPLSSGGKKDHSILVSIFVAANTWHCEQQGGK